MAGEEPGCVVVGVLDDQCHISLARAAPAISGLGHQVVGGLLLAVQGCRCGQLPCGEGQEVVVMYLQNLGHSVYQPECL